MATNRFRGDAVAVAQVSSATITADDATTTYKVTINTKVVSVVGSGTGTTATAALLLTALQTSTIPEFTEVTWTVASAVITGTSAVPGRPFTVTSSVSGGGGTFGAFSTTTTSTGPNDISVAANWSTGSLPANADDVVFDQPVDALYGLTALAAITPNSVTFAPTYGSHQVGLPVSNPGGYYEYRALYLQFAGVTKTIAINCNTPHMRIDTQATAAVVNVLNSGNTPSEAGAESVRIKGTALTTVQITKGSLGIARLQGEVSTVTTLDIGYQANQAGDAKVFMGPAVTITTITKSGGQLTMYAGIATITLVSQLAGTITIYDSLGSLANPVITTLTVDGGSAYYNGTGTITTLNVGNAGIVSFQQDLRARTITNTNLYKGATLTDPTATVTWTNPIALIRCYVSDVNLNLGENRKLAPS